MSLARSILIPMLFVIAASLGCGGSAYEKTFEDSLTKLRNNTGFMEVSELRVLDLENTEMSLRLPKVLTENVDFVAIDAKSNEPKDPKKPLSTKRLYPAGIPLPGYRRTYEAFLDGKGAEPKGVYCYLAAIPVRSMKGEALRAQILASYQPYLLRKDKTTWEEVQIRTPRGTKETWWRLSMQLKDQTFHFYEWEGPDKGTVKPLIELAKVEFFLHEGELENFLVGFRAVESSFDRMKLGTQFEASVGTVEFDKPDEG